MKDSVQINAAVKYWWRKAEESLASAEREFDAGSLTFAVNRLYYSLFYAVSAMLLSRDYKSFTKHAGVRAVFNRDFVKTGLVDGEMGRLYNQLFDDRQEGDYIAFVSFSSEEVASQLEKCNTFLEKLRPLVKDQIQ
ncbi:MAG: HEPN domain-containing protein [Candidatus Poribacteria bacterium]|nr:HEPN domain-containing protein [Candidatus Poribacteria bacterium]